MSNLIFDAMGRQAPRQGNLLQQITNFARTIQGNPEQIVRGLISSGRMSQQQFESFAQTARQLFPRGK